jgi:hypothetical protein
MAGASCKKDITLNNSIRKIPEPESKLATVLAKLN